MSGHAAGAPLRVLVVDDEPLARQLVRLLLQNEPEVLVVGECSGVDAEAAVARTCPDILFLDVQMPEVDGFELLARLGPERAPVVVFVTAYDQYAIRAFEVHALDYLLKPVDDTRFAAALERAKQQARARRRARHDDPVRDQVADRVASSPGDDSAGDHRGDAALADRQLEQLRALLRERVAPWPARLLVPTRDRTLVVEVDEIDWIEAADYCVSIHTGGRTHLLRETLAQLETRLDPERFCRVHRSAIVNVARVREIHPLFHGDAALVLRGGERVPLARTRRAHFERLFAAPPPPR